jgi:hypothetical protein
MKKFFELFWQYKLLIGTKFIEALGVLMLLYESLSLIDVITASKCMKVVIFIIIIIISALYVWCALFRQKEVLTLDINKRTWLKINLHGALT